VSQSSEHPVPGRADTVHPQVHIQHGEREAWVDAQLGPLILACWRAGIETWLSCQHLGPDGTRTRPLAWLSFPRWPDAEQFLRLLPPGVRVEVQHVTYPVEWEERPVDMWVPRRALRAITRHLIAQGGPVKPPCHVAPGRTIPPAAVPPGHPPRAQPRTER